MDESSKKILIIGTVEQRLDITNKALIDWTVHLAPDWKKARDELALHPSIRVAAVPMNPSEPYEAFLDHCRNRYPDLTPLMIRTESSDTPGFTNGMALPPLASPEALQDALNMAALPKGNGMGEDGGNAPQAQSNGISAAREIRFQQDWVKVVAHDIRSPLTLINSYATMLLRDGVNDEAHTRLIVERIRNSGQWMMALVDNILDLALLEEGRLELKCTLTPLGDILSRACENMRGLTQNAEVLLNWSTPGDLEPFSVDYLKIEQVLQNLIGNSIKSSEKGDRVEVSARVEGDHLTFEVRDWGRGMAPDQIERIFDRFSSTDTSPHGGRGLGLTIANTLVNLHGGDIQVDSTLGQGSTFTFTVRPQSGQEKIP